MSCLGSLLLLARAAPFAEEGHVVIISVDGLRPGAIRALGPAELPSFYRFRGKGAFTDGARTDPDDTNTLPNHISMITGRRVAGSDGHGWSENRDSHTTIHASRGHYIRSIFDVADNAGVRTALYASKTKFSLFDISYPIRDFRIDTDSRNLVTRFTSDLVRKKWGLSFLHISLPDNAGHASGWDINPGSPYMESILAVDALLARVFAAIEETPGLAGETTVLLTSDHGGGEPFRGHSDEDARVNHTVPLYAWGEGISAGGDLYGLNPGRSIIFAMEAGNLALAEIGLPPVPGSTANAGQDLRLRPAPGWEPRGWVYFQGSYAYALDGEDWVYLNDLSSLTMSGNDRTPAGDFSQVSGWTYFGDASPHAWIGSHGGWHEVSTSGTWVFSFRADRWGLLDLTGD